MVVLRGMKVELRLPTLQQCRFMVPAFNITHQTISVAGDAPTVLDLKWAILKLVGQSDPQCLDNLFLKSDKGADSVLLKDESQLLSEHKIDRYSEFICFVPCPLGQSTICDRGVRKGGCRRGREWTDNIICSVCKQQQGPSVRGSQLREPTARRSDERAYQRPKLQLRQI